MTSAARIRVVTVHGPGDVRLDTSNYPQVGNEDVLLRLRACGVCGTDIHYIKNGGLPRRSSAGPMPIGHEAAGEVVEVGGAVGTVKPGDRVIINPMASSAVIGNGAPEGAFSDFLLVRDANRAEVLLSIPEELSYEDAALAEPLAVALRAVNRAAPQVGESAVVYGTGPIGLGIILWLKRRGVGDVIAIDLSERRLELARSLGADHLIDAKSGEEAVAGQIRACHGEVEVLGATAAGTDMYFDAAGAPSVIGSVISLAKRSSRFVIVAMHGDPFPVDIMQFMSKEMLLTGSVGYREELGEALAVLPEISALARRMVTDRFRFDDVLIGLRRAAEKDSGKVIIEFSDTVSPPLSDG